MACIAFVIAIIVINTFSLLLLLLLLLVLLSSTAVLIIVISACYDSHYCQCNYNSNYLLFWSVVVF